MIRKADSNDLVYINKVLSEFNQPKIDSLTSEYLIIDSNKGLVNYVITGSEAEIYFIYVEKENRRKKYGGKLLEALINECKNKDCGKVFLEVRESNIIAQLFYKKFGFKVISRRKNYYRNPEEDAIILMLEVR